MSPRALLMAGGLFLSAASAAVSQATPPACSSDAYRQFDFWIGDWVVHDTAGVYQGANRIESIHGGCTLQENWTGQTGGTGMSFNIYDFTRGVWHQTWVSGAQLLVIEGGWAAGRMVLEGSTYGPNRVETKNRITWTPVAADTVTQVWDRSPDGSTWQTVFHGVYTRR